MENFQSSTVHAPHIELLIIQKYVRANTSRLKRVCVVVACVEKSLIW